MICIYSTKECSHYVTPAQRIVLSSITNKGFKLKFLDIAGDIGRTFFVLDGKKNLIWFKILHKRKRSKQMFITGDGRIGIPSGIFTSLMVSSSELNRICNKLRRPR